MSSRGWKYETTADRHAFTTIWSSRLHVSSDVAASAASAGAASAAHLIGALCLDAPWTLGALPPLVWQPSVMSCSSATSRSRLP